MGKARGSYLRLPRTLHFVPSVSGRSSPLRLDLELAHPEPVDLELSDPDLDNQLTLEAELQHALARTRDFQEGALAFLEKREPAFQGA